MTEAIVFCGFGLAVIVVFAALIWTRAARISFSRPRPRKDNP